MACSRENFLLKLDVKAASCKNVDVLCCVVSVCCIALCLLCCAVSI
jgi:hypothetical protein